MLNRWDATIIFLFASTAAGYFFLLSGLGLILCGPDQFFAYHPLQWHWLSQLFEGNLPWLANSVGGGMPLWADPNLAIFYPGNVLYILFSFHHAWNLSIVLHLLSGQIGIYWICRKQNLSNIACLTAAVAFLFSGITLASLNVNEMLITASWAPWILGLAYYGLPESSRKTALASLALACQWLGGFTSVQFFTLFLLVAVCIAAYRRQTSRVVLGRIVFLFTAALLAASIQWLPAALWIPNTDWNWFQIRNRAGIAWFHPGWAGTLLFAFALPRKETWGAVLCASIDYFLLGGTPLCAFFIAFAIAFGAQSLLNRIRLRPVTILIPVVVIAELILVNWRIPQSIPLARLNQPPIIISEIPDTTRTSIHWSGKRGALSPLAGLRWGLKYSTYPDGSPMVWRGSRAREAQIEAAIRDQKPLKLLRDSRIGYVISDTYFSHPELVLMRQNATKFIVHRVARPLSPLVIPSDKKAAVHWLEAAPNEFQIQTNAKKPLDLTIHKSALPGWKCRVRNQQLPISVDSAGWIKVQAPPGDNRILFVYRTPGAVFGVFLSSIGTLLLLAFLIL